MKVQALEKVVDDSGLLVVAVDTVEDLTRRLHRQRRNSRAFTAPGDCSDAGSDAEAHGLELTEFVNHGVDLLVI